MKLGTALLMALLLPIAAGTAQATPSTTATNVRLEVLGSSTCITREELASRVLARSPRIRFVDESTLSVQASVEMPRPGTVVADLVIASADGNRSPRRVVVRSCAEATDALALIITVTLDPTLAKKSATAGFRNRGLAKASEAASSPTPESVEAKSSQAEPPSTPGPQPTAKFAEPPRVLKEPAPPVKVEPAEPGSAPSPTARETATRRFGVSGAALSIFGPAPAVMPGVGLYGLAALERDSPWSPAVQIGFSRAWRSDLSEPGGKASFTLDTVSLDVCAVRLRWSLLEARACGAALVGRMTAKGAAYPDTPGTSARPFAVAGGALLVTAAIGATIELSARLGAGATLIRDTYDFSQPAFHRAGSVTTSGSLGLGAHWP